jgi:hypothetical protein
MDDVVDRLPHPYATCLRLRAAGVPVERIAARIGVPVEALPALTEIAERKLERLRRLDRSGGEPPGGVPD